MKPLLLVTLFTAVFWGCDKDNPPASPILQDACFINTAGSTVANSETAEYEFDNNNNLTVVKMPVSGQTVTIGSNTVTTDYTYLGLPAFTSIKYEVSDITKELPAKAFVSISDGRVTTVNYQTYFFFYDGKNQLVKVGQQTDNIAGDWEYDLDIIYNEQGNVTSLQYSWTTGPNQVIPPVTVAAYDDKPNPYAAVKAWRFINSNWNSSDPIAIIATLSKNNPLDYTMGSGASLFKREMTYEYNEKGFPLVRKNTNTNSNGQYTFSEIYTYNCK